MAKPIEAGQLGGYLNVNVATSDVRVGVVTINSVSGNIYGGDVYGNFIGNASTATVASGISSGANLNLGIVSCTQLSARSTSEIISSSNFTQGTGIVSIVYGSDPTIAICTNPSSNISLRVTGIPTTGFDNRILNFSVVIPQAGTGRSCTSVFFNEKSMPINWYGGTLFTATAGVTVTQNPIRGYDIYNFIGINTVGSGSTVDNYALLGAINGRFFI